jgi:hypothetical protein
MAVWVFGSVSFGDSKSSPMLFGKAGSKCRFGEWLIKNLKEYKEDLVRLGINAEDIGNIKTIQSS